MRHCYVVRVFTDGESGGNALGVIPDSVDLTTEAMQGIASKLGFSESVFMSWPAGGMPALRIFTPTMELPFAGHPVVGAAWVLNSLGPGADQMSVQIGEVGVRMENGACWVTAPDVDRPIMEVPAEDLGELGVQAQRAWRAIMPMDYLVAELPDAHAVDSVDPLLAAVKEACHGLYVFAQGQPTRSRFFCPAQGIDEDPATGSAAVALAAVLRSEGESSGRREIIQGPSESLSRVTVSWDESRVELAGTVVKDEVRLLDV